MYVNFSASSVLNTAYSRPVGALALALGGGVFASAQNSVSLSGLMRKLMKSNAAFLFFELFKTTHPSTARKALREGSVLVKYVIGKCAPTPDSVTRSAKVTDVSPLDNVLM